MDVYPLKLYPSIDVYPFRLCSSTDLYPSKSLLIVRSILFVEGGLNTNCTVNSNLFGSFKFEIRNKLNAEI